MLRQTVIIVRCSCPLSIQYRPSNSTSKTGGIPMLTQERFGGRLDYFLRWPDGFLLFVVLYFGQQWIKNTVRQFERSINIFLSLESIPFLVDHFLFCPIRRRRSLQTNQRNILPNVRYFVFHGSRSPSPVAVALPLPRCRSNNSTFIRLVLINIQFHILVISNYNNVQSRSAVANAISCYRMSYACTCIIILV